MSKRLQELERETAEMEVQLHKKRDEAEVKERVEGLGRAFRENFSLRLEQMRVSAQQHRQTVLEAVQLSSSLFGSGFNDFLNDFLNKAPKQKITIDWCATVFAPTEHMYSRLLNCSDVSRVWANSMHAVCDFACF